MGQKRSGRARIYQRRLINKIKCKRLDGVLVLKRNLKEKSIFFFFFFFQCCWTQHLKQTCSQSLNYPTNPRKDIFETNGTVQKWIKLGLCDGSVDKSACCWKPEFDPWVPQHGRGKRTPRSYPLTFMHVPHHKCACMHTCACTYCINICNFWKTQKKID